MLKQFFKPRRVAIVGASESDGLGGKTSRRFLETFGDHPGDVFFVNPNRETVFGQKAYQSIRDIPADFDLVVIATPKPTVEENLRLAIDQGARGAIIYASGYSETGDPRDVEDENRLRELCARHGVAVLGPNCAGYINFVDRIFPFGFAFDQRERPGRVGVISQSGQVCTSLLISPKTEFSYLISSGNSKITPIEDFLGFLVDDEDTGVIGAYLESVVQPRKFIETLARAARLGKPVVFLKSGRSDQAAKVAASHTGSLTGSDKSFEAVFAKFGVIRVDDIEELLCVCNALALMPALPGRNSVGLVCGSGGESAISADLCQLAGLNCPSFSESTLEELSRILPDYATPTNPLDTTGQVIERVETYEQALLAVAGDENVDLMIVGLPVYKEMRVDTGVMTEAIENVMRAQKRVPIVAVPNIETDRVPAIVKRLREAGVPLMPSSKLAFAALRKIIDYAEWRRTLEFRTLDCAIPGEGGGSGRRTLSETASKALLEEHGLSVPRSMTATSEADAARMAEILGWPVALKIESEDIPHKSDAGGVILNVRSPEEARAAYGDILRNVAAKAPGARINGVLVQTMLPKGLEVIIGLDNDRQFGPMLLLGLGGVFVELFKDAAVYPCPLNAREAGLMIESLKSSVLFKGYRGSPELDLEALTQTMVRISEMAVAMADTLLELDLNPLFVYEKGAGVAAADALAVLRD